MCLRCDEPSIDLDELLFGYHAMIEQQGWMVTAVEGDDAHIGWAYTVGLASTLDHPDLVIVGLPAASAHEILQYVIAAIAEGEAVLPGLPIPGPNGQTFATAWVHPAQIAAGLMPMWVNYYASLGAPPAVEAIQVRVPPPADVGDAAARLDLPGPLFVTSA